VYKRILILLLIVFLGACQQQGMETPDDQRNIDPPHDEEQNKEPLLVGGPEMDVREPHPISNDQLQQMFPDNVVLHASKDQKQVALSFDDGPDSRFTPEILDVLDKHQVHATFFMMGSRAKEHPDIVERVDDEGHAIGSHTYWHPNLSEEGLERLDWEVKETDETIENIVGYKPRLFRSPYGNLDEKIVERLVDLDHTIVGWDVDSLDWKQPGTDVIADNVLSNVSPGSIILMHDGGDWSMDLSGTVESLDRIITKLKEDSIDFVTIPELIDSQKEK